MLVYLIGSCTSMTIDMCTPSPHRNLYLAGNQLAVLPAGVFSGLNALRSMCRLHSVYASCLCLVFYLCFACFHMCCYFSISSSAYSCPAELLTSLAPSTCVLFRLLCQSLYLPCRTRESAATATTSVKLTARLLTSVVNLLTAEVNYCC